MFSNKYCIHLVSYCGIIVLQRSKTAAGSSAYTELDPLTKYSYSNENMFYVANNCTVASFNTGTDNSASEIGWLRGYSF